MLYSLVLMSARKSWIDMAVLLGRMSQTLCLVKVGWEPWEGSHVYSLLQLYILPASTNYTSMNMNVERNTKKTLRKGQDLWNVHTGPYQNWLSFLKLLTLACRLTLCRFSLQTLPVVSWLEPCGTATVGLSQSSIALACRLPPASKGKVIDLLARCCWKQQSSERQDCKMRLL